VSVWHWPQWTMALLLLFVVVLQPLGVGKPKGVKTELDAVMTAILTMVQAAILWCGGFWS